MLNTDVKCFASANMPEADTTASGGAIDTTTLVEFTDLATNGTLEVLSSSAADTMNLTIVGRDAGKAIASETKALNGTTVVSFTTTLERLLKATLASAAAGTITIRRSGGGATLATLAAGQLKVRRLFYDAASEAGATTRFEKVFFKNTHGVDTLSAAAVVLSADPAATVRIGVAAAKGDTGSVANRKTSPGVTFVDDGVSQAVPTSVLAAGETIGVWVEMARGANAAAIKNTFTMQLSGTSG